MPDGPDDHVQELLAQAERTGDPAHEAWLRCEIERTLRDKAAGTLSYRTLAGIAAKLGLDAS